MEITSTQWDVRLDRVLGSLLWITLAIGVFTAFLRDGPTVSAYAASGMSGAYVLVAAAVPRYLARRRIVRELVVVIGSVLTMTAVAITGHVDSPFLLLSLLPVLSAGAWGGFRAGIAAAALSSGILASVVIPLPNPPWTELTRWAVLLFLIAITFGYARRLLSEVESRSDALAAASADTSIRLERLETAHRLLTRLAARAESAELNPIEVGAAALDSVRGVVPFKAASVSLASESGQVAVARIGDPYDGLVETRFPMEAGGRRVGGLVVGTDRELTRRQRESIETVLQPASLAFSNILLLQEIARTAIREERTRLARELHDDIGPSLASLGLALDLVALQYPTEPALGAHLRELRDSVGGLGEDVRTTVTDLRAPEDYPSLRESVRWVMDTRNDAAPSVLFQVDERARARPSIASHLNAIVTESIRNSIAHSGASTITVRGFIDYSTGSIEIRDNGRGFNPEGVGDRRFGLIGMKERADAIGARIMIDSTESETVVSLTWGR
jgi:signal transduction histidine kinase